MSKERIIYDNYNIYDTYSDEDMIELAIENGMADSKDEVTESMIDDLRWDEDAIDWETAKRELADYFKNETVIFFGTLGLWYGRTAGGKTGDFENLLMSAIQDCTYVKIYENNGRMFLECSHHDGTNEFEIKIINERGKQYLENWEYGSWNDKRTLQDVHTQIIKRYSRRPQFCKNVYDAI